ncbi:potassium channel family protein [Paucibacter sp. KBW04]|uniref:potassium channel family protein n=1 Tax=Paucibacter sp. KBW04 TaxID=2153361 RepID=UPI001E320FEA|nr:potassium channel family protein [Paucibacter sp. KBW04]
MTLVAMTLSSGTIFFRTVEGWSWIDAFYFSVTTMSTIGSPGLAPQSDFGKLFTTLYIVVAVGLFVALIAFLAEGMVANSRALRDKTSNAGSNRSPQPD